MFPRDEDAQRELMYNEQVKTNELLSKLIELIKPQESQKDDLSTLKRPELMKRMSQLTNKPQGFNQWETEKMRDYLRGKSA